MTEAALVEGQWKSRWLVLRKPSPVADCLLMLVYKDRSERARGLPERSSQTLERICGLEPGLPYEGLAHTLAVVCLPQAVMLGFDSREAMCAWDARIRCALGEVHRFHVTVAPGTKLESGPATLHLCNDILVVARDVPPVVTGQWKLSDLRRYGAVPNGFIFEGGTRCGYWAGVFFLSSAEGEQISFLFDCIVRGISPTKGPFGLRPVLPGAWGARRGRGPSASAQLGSWGLRPSSTGLSCWGAQATTGWDGRADQKWSTGWGSARDPSPGRGSCRPSEQPWHPDWRGGRASLRSQGLWAGVGQGLLGVCLIWSPSLLVAGCPLPASGPEPPGQLWWLAWQRPLLALSLLATQCGLSTGCGQWAPGAGWIPVAPPWVGDTPGWPYSAGLAMTSRVARGLWLRGCREGAGSASGDSSLLQTPAPGDPPPRSEWPRKPWKRCSWRSGSASSPTSAGPAAEGTTAACPARRQKPATRTSAPAVGSPRGRSSPRPRPARRRRGPGWRRLRPRGKPCWAPRGRLPSRRGRGSCRRWAARAPRTAASPRAATPPTRAASPPAPGAAWTCGAAATSSARCSACHRQRGRPSPACAPARPGQRSTRCPAPCGPITTRPAACARPPGTRPPLPRAAPTAVQPGTPAARRPQAAPPVRGGGDRRRRPRAAKPPECPGKQAAPTRGPLRPSFPRARPAEGSR
ncbi:protein Dok-7 isoform X2 [Phyllostomus discolor]|uniref:Protein Dok-7 isoform X2 n=1 Tax=Phyllostomus discolor TaxID=89673 RepID=A0A7E6D4J7_9CHIR|nr:protein Dok-7 isoform X2 [Phyllostomus discolor]